MTTEAEIKIDGEDKPQVVEVRNAIPANVVIRIFVIGVAIAALLPSALTIGLRWHDQDKRIHEVEELANANHDLSDRLVKVQAQLKGFVSTQCKQAETRDVATVQTNQAILLLLKDVPGSAALARFRQSLEDANLLLEPPGEKDCQPGPGDQNP